MSDETETTVMPIPSDDERTQTIDAVPAETTAIDTAIFESVQTETLPLETVVDETKPLETVRDNVDGSNETSSSDDSVDMADETQLVEDSRLADESQTVEESAAADDLDMTKPLDELAREKAERDARNTQTVPQVPLYATQPPSGGSAARGGSVPQGGNPWAQPGPQPFVQVPSQPVTERPVIHKTGPSGATIVLGVLLAIMGVIAIVFGMETPILSLNLVADSRMMVGVIFGAVGGGLVLIAIIWGLVGLIRSKSRSAEGDEDSDGPEIGKRA